MNRDAIRELAAELREKQVSGEQEFLMFLPLAARLAACGDSSQLERWPKLAKDLGCDLDRLLTDRCKEGEWELREATGEDIGLSIIAAQDFACLLEFQKDVLPLGASRCIEAWTETAEAASLDAAAVGILERFLDLFPLPEHLRLTVVDSPLTETEQELIARMTSAPPMITGIIKSPKLPAVRVADGEKAPAALMSSYELDHQKIMVKDGIEDDLFFSRRLYGDWNVVFTLMSKDNQPVSLQAVRLGSLPCVADDFDGPWSVSLSRIPWNRRIAALSQPVVFQFTDGIRLSVTCLTDNYHQA